MKSDGTAKDGHFSIIGYVKEDGTIKNDHYSAISYAKGMKPAWAAARFFFFFGNERG